MDETRPLEPIAILKDFLALHVPAAAGVALSDETDLLGSGVLDSLAILQLMEHLASSHGIEIADEDFSADNLATVGSLKAFIARKSACR